VIRAAQERGVKASICGEIASDREAIPILLSLGFRAFSVTAAAVPAIKSQIRKLSIAEIAPDFASQRLSFVGPSDVRKVSRKLAR
jgi:phosphoenolpyruvate-protein kinase (PTS system EI component)